MEMVSKYLQKRGKGKQGDKSCHPLLRLTIETQYQDSVAQIEGPTQRTGEQTDRCGKPTNTPPQARAGILFFQCAEACGLVRIRRVLYH